MSETPLLQVENLEKHYPIREGLLQREIGRVRAVDGVSFDVRRGEAFGLVGESGCGKSTTALSLLRLEEPTAGDVRFDSESVLDYGADDLRAFRRRAQLVVQDPNSAFNPRQTIGDAVAEPLRTHGLTDKQRRRRVVRGTLERVGLGNADLDSYPHEFSGGEKQRIAIARALVLNPDLIVADEPVSALDGRTRSGVLDLLADLRAEFDLSILLISHDIDMVRRFCDRIAVMYLGSVVERGETSEVVADAHHPYTQTLLASVPSLDPRDSSASVDSPTDELPDASDVPAGCRFHPRCPAIIQPEELTLPRDEWLSLVAFRRYLADDWESVERFRQSLPAPSDGDTGLSRRVRRAFELPEEFADEAAERAVAATIEALDVGGLERARTALADTVTTVCQRESPELTDEHRSWSVACHRYDPDFPGDPDTGIQFEQYGE